MVLKYNDIEISSLDDIQKLKAKDLREIVRSNSESTGGMRADLVMKVYALLMRHVFPSSGGENRELPTDVQDLKQNQSDFKYEATMVRISALGWSSDLRNLPEMNFIHLYDYLVVSTRKYRHIVLEGTHYKKLKSYQFFFEDNVKKLESKVFGKCSPLYEENALQSYSRVLTYLRCATRSVYVPCWPPSSRKRKMQPHRRSAVCYRGFYKKRVTK